MEDPDQIEPRRARLRDDVRTLLESQGVRILEGTGRLTSSTTAALEHDGTVEEFADVEHLWPFDTHETIRLTPGKWEIRRQREWSPEGWRRVED